MSSRKIENVDTFLIIGDSHHICEDYIISGMYPSPYIILGDGCSSSKNTDVGSRILVHCVKNILTTSLSFDSLISKEDLGYKAIDLARDIINKFDLNLNSLDSTIIVMFEFKGNIYTYFYGDGHLFLRHKGGSFTSHAFQYKHNAPYYLSYNLDLKRMTDYQLLMSEEYNKSFTHTVIEGCNSNDFIENNYYENYNSLMPFIINIEKSDIEYIGIASDGVESFCKNGDKKNAHSILTEFVAFKNVKGEFVKRRCKKAIKSEIKDGWKHYDDISFGAFVIGEDKRCQVENI